MRNILRKRKKNLLERMSFEELSKTEQMAIYLHNHPECLTERLMTHVAARLMNYGYIRLRIKQMYRQIILDNVKKNNFVAISDYNDEEEE